MDLCNEEEGRLRVSMTRGDLAHFHLSFEQLDYHDPQTRAMFQELSDSAGRLTGFRDGDGRLLIEVFPAPDGGCTIYFTALATLDGRTHHRLRRTRPAPDIYRFESSGDLLDALDSIAKSGTEMRHKIYLYENKYYMCADRVQKEGLKMLLSEYSAQQSGSPVTAAFLREHGRLISPPPPPLQCLPDSLNVK